MGASIMLGAGRRRAALSGGRGHAALAQQRAGPMTSPERSIEIAVRTHSIGHLFNSFDPSPFREKDLDAGVEDFLVSWVRELPVGAPFTIVVHLPSDEAAKPDAAGIGEAFAHYFEYRAEASVRELRELFRIGRRLS